MIKISFRDVLADLPPSILKKRIKDIDEKRKSEKWILAYKNGDWTNEIKQLNILKDDQLLTLKGYARLIGNELHILGSGDKWTKGMNMDIYYNPKLDFTLSCPQDTNQDLLNTAFKRLNEIKPPVSQFMIVLI